MSAAQPTAPDATPTYEVFISHSGEDHHTVAYPLRDLLQKRGITAFAETLDLPAGTLDPPSPSALAARARAMEGARLALLVISPEVIARKWPMKEMLYFQSFHEEGVPNPPAIIPFYYRLEITQLYDEPRLDRNDVNGEKLYEESKFYIRQRRGDPEASIAGIKAAMVQLQMVKSVGNDEEIGNEDTEEINKKREKLLEVVCDKICEALSGSTSQKAARSY